MHILNLRVTPEVRPVFTLIYSEPWVLLQSVLFITKKPLSYLFIVIRSVVERYSGNKLTVKLKA